MFDFLFKRRRADTVASTQAVQAQAAAAAVAARTQLRQQDRQQALQQAAALSDEQAALAFIVHCEFADARLQAAQWLQSASALTEALRAVRNSDRRVAKLLQTRLDTLLRRQRAQLQMQIVLEQTEALLLDPSLTPDRAADADRAWDAAGGTADATAHEALSARFSVAREALSTRLGQQAQLQRSLVDARMHLLKILDLLQAAAPGNPADNVDADTADVNAEFLALPVTLEHLQQQITQYRDAPEVAALPKQLLPDCEQLLSECQSLHAQMAADAAARLLRARAGENRLAEQGEQSDLSSRTLQTEVQTPKIERRTRALAASPEQLQLWQDQLTLLETALEQGALQAAGEAERALRAHDVRLLKPGAEAVSRMNAAYASLHHLQGWARWGGNISREELLQAALALPQQALPVPELVQKIGGLRARWKLLSVSAGPAAQTLWENFDAACTAAYAPAAAQFEQQDRERQENRLLADGLIAEIAQFAQQHGMTLPRSLLSPPPLLHGADGVPAGADDSADPAPVETETDVAEMTATAIATATATDYDWKQLAQFDARMRQAWQRLGPLGHKEKRILERTFNAALKSVQAPLRERQKIEIEAREAMIAEVACLNSDDRQALDTLRRIQAEWQQRAQAVPLARKDEQTLWQTFRVACDAVFAQRKEVALNQDAQRQENLRQKQTVCEQLEQTLAVGASDVAAESGFDAAFAQSALLQAKSAWSGIGAVPRAAERAIEQRFRVASDGLQRQIKIVQDHAVAEKIAAEATNVDTRIMLCFALEASLSRGNAAASGADIDALAEGWRAQWQAAPRLARPLEQALTQRFETALVAIGSSEGYLQHLQQQRARFDETLLEVEIALGLDSPPELARQRMQLQVALLQSSLKAGAATLTGQQQLLRLCALPALADQSTLERVHLVIRQATQH